MLPMWYVVRGILYIPEGCAGGTLAQQQHLRLAMVFNLNRGSSGVNINSDKNMKGYPA